MYIGRSFLGFFYSIVIYGSISRSCLRLCYHVFTWFVMKYINFEGIDTNTLTQSWGNEWITWIVPLRSFIFDFQVSCTICWIVGHFVTKHMAEGQHQACLFFSHLHVFWLGAYDCINRYSYHATQITHTLSCKINQGWSCRHFPGISTIDRHFFHIW